MSKSTEPLLVLLLLSVVATPLTEALPLAHIHTKFIQPPHIQEHGLTTNGGQVIEQHSYVLIGDGNLPINSQAVGQGVHYAAQDNVNYAESVQAQQTPEFDPLLLTGEDAKEAVKYLYGRGELFFKDIPHERALLMNQQLRRQNGLSGNILSSLRPESSWYRQKDRR